MSNDRFDVLDRLAPLFEAPRALLRGVPAPTRPQAPEPAHLGGCGRDRCLRSGDLDRDEQPVVRSDRDAGCSRTGADRTDGVLGPGVWLPPKGAEPSTPAEGDVVLQTVGIHPWHYIQVYADGRVIWSRQTGFTGNSRTSSTTGWLERRLTPEGVDLVRSGAIRLADLDAPSQVPASVYGRTPTPSRTSHRGTRSALRGPKRRCVSSLNGPGSAPRPDGRASSPNRRGLFFLAPRGARGGVSGDDDRGGSRSRQDLPRGWVRTKRNCLGALLRHQGPGCFLDPGHPLLPDGEANPCCPESAP